MDLSRIHLDFSDRLRVESGGFLLGQISGFRGSVDDRSIPDRILKVSPASRAAAGDVVHTPLGETFILAEHHASFGGGATYKTFRMIRADKKLAWSRVTTVVDPVTNLPRKSGAAPLGEIFVAVDPIKLEGETKMKPESRVRIATGVAVEVGDRIGDYSVLFIEDAMGIKIAEAR